MQGDPIPRPDALMTGQQLADGSRAPTLALQNNPRLVVAGNEAAMGLFGKTHTETAGHRGGEVFDCVHAFTEAGCGKDAHCEPCLIRRAIVDTLETGTAHQGVATSLNVRKAGGEETYRLCVSTAREGDVALVTIEEYCRES